VVSLGQHKYTRTLNDNGTDYEDGSPGSSIAVARLVGARASAGGRPVVVRVDQERIEKEKNA
jgi:hypothetical protein